MALPIRLSWNPWYSTTEEMSCGERVSVFFARRQYTGVVLTCSRVPGIDPSKIIPARRSPLPSIAPQELSLWNFIADYYLCTIGEVYKAAYPSGKVKSESIAAIAEERAALRERKTLETLQLRVQRLEDRRSRKIEAIATKKDGTKTRAALEDALAQIEAQLRMANNAVDAFQSKLDDSADVDSGKTSVSNFADALTGGQKDDTTRVPATTLLSPEDHRPVLLVGRDRIKHYITETGRCIEKGCSVLLLVPENGLTKALEASFVAAFGSRVRLFNSDLSVRERRRTADALRGATSPYVVIGTRTALFLPHTGLGLVIVDEEQDPSFKQIEPSPRYNARDCAVVLAKIHGAGIILGSACPSLESERNAAIGKYRCIRINNPNARIEVIDISKERRKRGMDGAFSFKLIDAVRRFNGPVILVRGWEKEDELQAKAAELFPGREISIVTHSAARTMCSRNALIAVLQADSLMDEADFRSDEKTLQALRRLEERCTSLIVQTAKSSHPVFEAIQTSNDAAAALLKERKAFNLPPFTRLVDVISNDSATSETVQKELSRRLAHFSGGIVRLSPTVIRCTLPQDSTLQQAKEAIRTATLAIGNSVCDTDPR